MEIATRNVNSALSEALWKLKVMGREESSRNGPVIAFPEPVMTTYERPQERVLFWDKRDCNPVFHLLESVWMLAGRRDVAFPQMFNSRFGQYSDDGKNFNAAYGYRWRKHFGYDQLERVIEVLTKDRNTRQAVMQIWEPSDLGKATKDKACNTQVFFEIRADRLNMTVLNRSNDLWYGAYGSNAVHFSVLQEFVASAVGVPLGVYRQFSHNLHLYTKLCDAVKHLDNPPSPESYDAYLHGVKPSPLMSPNTNWKKWLLEAEYYCENPFSFSPWLDSFFKDIAYPMAMASKSRKDKTGDGIFWANQIAADDWRIATLEWIQRREEAKK